MGLGCSAGHARGSSQGGGVQAVLYSCDTVCAAGLILQEALGFALPQVQGLKPHPCCKPLGLPNHVLLGNCHPGTPAWSRGTLWVGPAFFLTGAFKPLFCFSLLTYCNLDHFPLIHPVSYQTLPQPEQQHQESLCLLMSRNCI